MPELFSAPGSAVVQAGAGTGKTHSLVTLCLHLLGGIGRETPLSPSRLWAVTFTEKAAAELKGRLRQRIDALAEFGGEDAATPSPATSELSGLGAVFWRKVRRDLGLAQVGTIHSLCGQILRRHAAAAGIDPGFSLLDEAQGRRLLRESCEAVSLRALEGALGPEEERAARRLCGEMGLRGQGDFDSGLADELTGLLAALGESGKTVQQLVAQTKGLSLLEAREEDLRARRELLAAMESLRSAVQQARGAGKTIQSAAEAAAAFRPDALVHEPGDLASTWPLLRGSCARLPGRVGPLAEVVGTAKAAFEALLDADAGVRGAGLARDLALLAGHAVEHHREEKARQGALDFDDLTRLCRDLLVQHPLAREAERQRAGVLLVDEFQDTSRTQLALIAQLCGGVLPGAAGGAPEGAADADGAALVVVGDRKQSIYEFRGADVAGAQAFSERMLAQGAGRYVLQQSRRSQPALVGFQNLLFARVLAASGRPFDTPFSADDALSAFRPAGATCCAELLDVEGAGVEAEAELMSRRIAALLAPGAEERVFDAVERPRPVRGGDIAILLRRFTNLEAFRRALLRRRIPHLVYKGRGFHETREVTDLVALLTVASDPDDALALAAVLRSPLGPLSDDALALLARGNDGRGLDVRALRRPPPLAADDLEVLARLSPLIETLQREADRLGPAAILEAALAATDYLAACAGGLYGEQAAANVDKFVSLARAAELRGESVRDFLSTLKTLESDEGREPEAPVVEERDPHAVRLLTIHAAKGLEFPVVFVPECATPSALPGAARVLSEPDLGLAFKARGADGRRRFGPPGRALADRKLERELSQSRRLLYVAVTRARDRVVLSGRAARPQQESWRRWIDEISGEAVQRGLLRVSRDGGRAPGVAADRAPVDPEQIVAASSAPPAAAPHPQVERVLSGGARSPSAVWAPVSQIADAAACPRRYQLLHELRLDERPEPEPHLPDPLGPDPFAPAAALGTLAHRLLELLPLRLQDDARRAELERLLTLEGEDPAQHGQVLEAACAFLDSPLGKRMAAARPEHLERERPFTLRLTAPGVPELLLRGQLDALLLEDDAATVVDYKLSQARDPSRYSAQLDAYALAASELLQGALPVRTGIVFLRSKGAPYLERPPADLPKIRARLLEAGAAIARGRSTGTFPKVEPERCRELGCGFLRRCHGHPPA